MGEELRKERSPEEEEAESQRLSDFGFNLVKQDEDHLEHGPITREMRAIRMALWRAGGESIEDLIALKAAYIERFGSVEAERHRLYHAAFGGSPLGTANAFDIEGEEKEEWSFVRKMRELAKKYNINIEEV